MEAEGKASRILLRNQHRGSSRTDTRANAASGHSWTSGLLLLGEQQSEEPSLRRRSVVGACESGGSVEAGASGAQPD